jgi:hypothetical protein
VDAGGFAAEGLEGVELGELTLDGLFAWVGTVWVVVGEPVVGRVVDGLVGTVVGEELGTTATGAGGEEIVDCDAGGTDEEELAKRVKLGADELLGGMVKVSIPEPVVAVRTSQEPSGVQQVKMVTSFSVS